MKDFREDCFTRAIGEVVLEMYERLTNKHVGQSEINSWSASLQQVAIALNSPDIPGNAGVAIVSMYWFYCRKTEMINDG